MKKVTKKSAILAATVVGLSMTAGVSLAATALVPQGTQMSTMSGPGNINTTISGSVQLKDLITYNHDGSNNTKYAIEDLGTTNGAGPYNFSLPTSTKATAPYGFTGGGFNFQHFVPEVDKSGKICNDVVRWARINGGDCFNGCPAYMNFNPVTKQGIITVPVHNMQTGNFEAEYTVYGNITPAAQAAFMIMFNGGAIMSPIDVNK